jgi:PleD family two-component response regulator
VFLADRGDGSRLTVSTGVATLPSVAHSADVLLHAADAAMYRVKEAGRDGVHVAAPGSVAPVLNGAPDEETEEGEFR